MYTFTLNKKKSLIMKNNRLCVKDLSWFFNFSHSQKLIINLFFDLIAIEYFWKMKEMFLEISF